MIFNIHAGHAPAGGLGCGAVGILDESTEARKVKDKVIALLKSVGHNAYDCTCNENKSQSAVLSDIVAKCNAHTVNLDVSIHLNSGRNDFNGDNSTGGVEVYGYDVKTQEIGNRICTYISNTLNIRNRGFKTNSSLYVLANTKAPAILIECAFVDDKDDANVWNADKVAKAIVEGITGSAIATVSTPTVAKVDSSIVVQAHVENRGWMPSVNVGGIAGTVGQNLELEAIKIISSDPIYGKVHIGGIGWVDSGLINNGKVMGTVGQHKAIECICLKGAFEYRVHIQNNGWSAWTKADGIATLGTVGKALHIEAIQLRK